VHCGTITPVIRCGFSPNFARYSDVVSSKRVVFVRNRNWISDFRGVQIHILAAFSERERSLYAVAHPSVVCL